MNLKADAFKSRCYGVAAVIAAVGFAVSMALTAVSDRVPAEPGQPMGWAEALVWVVGLIVAGAVVTSIWGRKAG